MSRNKKYLQYIATTSLAFSLLACSDNKSVEEYQAEVKQYIQQQDLKSAQVTLKNAIKATPNNASFRYELGLIYLSQGAYANAEKELDKAQALGLEDENLLPRIAETKFKLFKFEEVYKIVESAQYLSDSHYVQVLTYAGLSSLYEGKREEAIAYIDRANQVSSESVYGQIGKAYLSQTKEEAEEALTVLNSLVAYAPDITEIYLLKGYLLQAAQQHGEAAKTFEQYNKLRPYEYQVQFFVAQNYLAAQQVDEASRVVNNLLKLQPNHPLSNQLKAQVEFDKQNYQNARDFAIKAYQQNNKFYLSIILAGVSSYYLGDYEQSYDQLIKVKDLVTSQHLVSKLLVDLQLRLGYSQDARMLINQLIDDGEASSSMLVAASNELFQTGDLEGAEQLLLQSMMQKEQTTDNVVAQGIMKIKLEDFGAAVDTLEKALSIEPDSEKAQAALAMGYLNNNEYNQAMAIAKQWQQTNKKIPGLLLEVEIYKKQQNLVAAKETLNNILVIEPNNLAALYGQAVISHQQKRFSDALTGYKQVLALKSNYSGVLQNITKLASLDEQYQKQIVDFFTAQVIKKPNDNYYKLGLANAYKVNNQFEQSIKYLNEVLKSEDPIKGVEIALGDSYFYLKRFDDAIRLYQQYLNQNPANFLAGQRLINVYELTHQIKQGLELVEQLYSKHGNKKGLLLLKVYFQSLLNITLGTEDIRNIEASETLASSWLYAKAIGNQALHKKNYAAAINSYKQAYEKKTIGRNAIDFARAYALGGDANNAISILENHLQSKGKDLAVEIMLANAYLNNAQNNKAIDMYLDILKQAPEHVISLNNLAYLQMQEGKAELALTYIERASQLSPKAPAVLDTYAQVLVANDRVEEALSTYDSALELLPNNIEISINKAKALILNNQVDEARQLLQRLQPQQEQHTVVIKQLLNSVK